MQKQLTNKFIMYQAVQNILATNKSRWEAVQAMGTTIQAFEELLNEINACNLFVSESKKGQTKQKKELRIQVIELTIEVAGVLDALILQTDEQYRGPKLDYSPSKLKKMRDFQLETTCKVIAEQAAEHLTLMNTAGITATYIDALKTYIKTFGDMLPRQRISLAERKVANEKLNDLFEQTDALLKKQLDRLMFRYKQSEPEFYFNYKSSRHVIKYGVRHKKVKDEEKKRQADNSEQTNSE